MAPVAEGAKPQGKPCQFLCKRGCSIYDKRPYLCEGFSCIWLATQDPSITHEAWEKGLRPDRTGVVLELNSAGTVIAHCRTREAWRREPIYSKLLSLAERDTVMIYLPNTGQNYLLNPDGSIEEMVKVGMDEVTHNNLYARRRELEAAGML